MLSYKFVTGDVVTNVCRNDVRVCRVTGFGGTPPSEISVPRFYFVPCIVRGYSLGSTRTQNADNVAGNEHA